MVAIISTGKSLYGALAYNEKKVEQGQAVLLGAVNSLARAEKQTLAEKAKSLQSIADRNQRTKRNSVHIALSFAKGDNLDVDQLRQIAKDYLKGIGFEGQPAYLYRHHDTANDHIHIVTTNITREGKRINDSFIGATKSETTRKEIEIAYGLVKAEEQQKQSTADRLSQLRAPAGEDAAELRSFARNIIRDTLKTYRPTEIGELNALLRDRDLKIRLEKGQRPDGTDWRGYSVVRIDGRTGQETSAAIKASKVFEAGWADKLDKRLADNVKGAEKSLQRVKAAVQDAFAEKRASAEDVGVKLSGEGVRAIHHHNAEGRRFGIHYVDEQSGHVFKASQVGRKYSATEWNRREETNTLNHREYKNLVGDVKAYLTQQRASTEFQSVAIKHLDEKDLQRAMVRAGHDSQRIGPYLADLIAAEKKDYEKALKYDQKRLKELYWGLAQVKQDYRKPLMNSLDLVRAGETITVRGNNDLSVPAQDLPTEQGRGVKDFEMGQLSAEERRMLVGVGRYRGIGGIPLDVNMTTVDWKYWQEKFKPATAEKLGQQLHNNHIKKELTLLLREAQKEEGRQKLNPLIHLASKGILIEPTASGTYRAHMVGMEGYSIQVHSKFRSAVHQPDYGDEHYQKMKSLLTGEEAKKALETLQQAEAVKLRSKSERKVPSSLNQDLRNYLISNGAQAQRSGLYKVLQTMDEDENLSQEERKQNRTLRL